MAAKDMITINEKHLIAESAVQQVCVGGTDEEPTVDLHLGHGIETFTGDEAMALIEHYCPACGTKAKAAKAAKAKAEHAEEKAAHAETHRGHKAHA